MKVRQAIAACRESYLSDGGTVSTWEGDYWKALKELPQDGKLSKLMLTKFVQNWPSGTRSRVRACTAAQKLAQSAGLDWKAGKLRGTYKAQPVDPSKIPTDEQIEAFYHQLQNQAWRWIYGAIACYGLRPHEALKADIARQRTGDQKFWVPSDTKTGDRRVWPLYPEWYYSMGLQRCQIPPIDLNRPNDKIGHSATEYFSRTAKMPWNLYAMRHAWARRAYYEGLADTAAAKMMGHSLELHQTTYRGWFDDLECERAYEKMLKKRTPRKL